MRESKSFSLEQRNLEFIKTKAKIYGLSQSRFLDAIVSEKRMGRAKAVISQIMTTHELRIRELEQKIQQLEKEINICERELKI